MNTYRVPKESIPPWAARMRVLGAANHELVLHGVPVMVIPTNDYAVDFAHMMQQIHKKELVLWRQTREENMLRARGAPDHEFYQSYQKYSSDKKVNSIGEVFCMIVNDCIPGFDPAFSMTGNGPQWNRLRTGRIYEIELRPLPGMHVGDTSRISVIWLEQARL